MRTGPTNVYLKGLIESLRKHSFEKDTPIWKVVAEKLANSRRRRVEINISDIERNMEKDGIAVVPGVVLSSGEITKPVTVAAWRFTPTAKEKIKKSGGKCIDIEDLVKENPKGTDVKILT